MRTNYSSNSNYMSNSYHQDKSNSKAASSSSASQAYKSSLNRDTKFLSSDRLNSYRPPNNYAGSGSGLYTSSNPMSTSMFSTTGTNLGIGLRGYSSTFSQPQPPRRCTSYGSGLTITDGSVLASANNRNNYSTRHNSYNFASSNNTAAGTPSTNLTYQSYRSKTPTGFRGDTNSFSSNLSKRFDHTKHHDRENKSNSRSDDQSSSSTDFSLFSKFDRISLTKDKKLNSISKDCNFVEKKIENICRRYMPDAVTLIQSRSKNLTSDEKLSDEKAKKIENKIQTKLKSEDTIRNETKFDDSNSNTNETSFKFKAFEPLTKLLSAKDLTTLPSKQKAAKLPTPPPALHELDIHETAILNLQKINTEPKISVNKENNSPINPCHNRSPSPCNNENQTNLPNVRNQSELPPSNIIDQATSSIVNCSINRCSRTINNLVDEIQDATLFKRQKNILQKSEKEAEHLSDKQKNIEIGKLRVPLLLVTQDSQQDDDEEVSANIVWHSSVTNNLNREEEDDEEYEDEEKYMDEDEEEFESDWEYDASVKKTLQLLPFSMPTNVSNTLTDIEVERNISLIALDGYESEFELPFIKKEDVGRFKRVSHSDALPPPIFTAFVSYDGMDELSLSWDSAKEESLSLGCELDDEYNVDCSLTFVEKAALCNFDDEDYSSTSADEYYHSSEYEDESYVEEDSELTDEEREDIEIKEKKQLVFKEISEDEKSITAESESSNRSNSSAQVESLEIKLNTAGVAFEENEIIVKKDKTEETQLNSLVIQKTFFEDQNKPFLSEKQTKLNSLYAKTEEEQEHATTISSFLTQKPHIDFAKKIVIQPMCIEKIKLEDVPTIKTSVIITTQNLAKTKLELINSKSEIRSEYKTFKLEKIKSNEAINESTISTTESNSNLLAAINSPKMPSTKSSLKTEIVNIDSQDKSAFRKSTLNMTEKEKKKADQLQQDLAKQRARRTGAVSLMTERFKESPVKEELITYKRSTRLAPKDDVLLKRTYAPIVKPVINDHFEKQMTELREQMKSKETKLLSEYREISHGIHTNSDNVKLKAMEEKHKARIGFANEAFSKVEEEKQRLRESRESEAERRHNQALQQNATALKDKQLMALQQQEKAIIEPQRLIRRPRKDDLVLVPTVESNIESSKSTMMTKSEKTSLKENLVLETMATATLSAVKKSSITSINVNLETSRQQNSNVKNLLVTKTPAPLCDLYYQRGSRRKTEELMNVADVMSSEGATSFHLNSTTNLVSEDKENLLSRKRKHRRHPQRQKHYFTRKPFDIDELLGWTNYDTFEKMDAFFASEEKMTAVNPNPSKKIKIVRHQKVWISELHDFDKIYKSSELRDIKFSADAFP